MDPKKRLEFIHKMTKMGLDHIQHLDSGGIAGTISNVLGTNDNFQAGSADIKAGTTQDQLNSSYGGVQSGLGQQQDLANTLAPQAAQGAAQQQQLAQMFSNQANGTGPNVAVNQLNQATGANTATQAALQAGQRGASSNPALMARQIAQQGAANQQNAVGQAATLGAQQQIAGQQNLASLSNNQIAQTGSAVGQSSQAQQGEQNILQNANTAANNAAVNMQSNVNNVNAGVAAGNQQANMGIAGGLLKGVSGLFAEGGEVAKKTGSPDSVPEQDASKYDQTMSNGWDNIKNVFKAEGGDVKANDSSNLDTSYLSQSPDVPQSARDDYAQESDEKHKYDNNASGNSISPVHHGYLQRFAAGGPIMGNPLVQAPMSAGAQSFAGQWLSQPSASIALTGPGQVASPTPMKSLAESLPDKKAKPQPTKGSPGNLPGAGYVDETNPPAGTTSLAGGASDPIAPTEDVPGGGSSYSVDGSGPLELAAGGGQITKQKAGQMLKNKLMKTGGKVKAKSQAQKAVKPGNSYDNDKVPTMLSEGEIVIPRSITTHQNAPEMAANFVRATLAKKGLRK